MENKILVPLALLRAALIASKDEDEFDFRNLDAIAINKGHIVATDGSIMFYAKLENVEDDTSFIIPKAYVQSFVKKTESYSGLTHSQISYDTETQTGLIEIPNHHNAYEGFKVFLSDSYIDWQKVLPESDTEYQGFVRFGGEYITILEEISGILGSICRHNLKPTGLDKAAIISFKFSDFENVNAVLMPRSNNPDSELFCVAISDSHEDEVSILPAVSAELAFKAAQRLRKDFIFNPRFKEDYSPFSDGASWIYPAVWNGSKQAHSDQLEIKEEWFSKPLKRYDDAELAIKYIQQVNDCVECYLGDKSIVATTVEQVTKFFNENKALNKAKLWSVNIPEEPDSAPILHPVPSQKIGKQLVHRLKQEALKQFPTVGQSIANAVTLEEWNGSETEHAEYLKSNPKWWLHETFLENGNA
ncbi:hypothetical protein [Acinetobacter beijerinckii]|uniref:hypothetical protein n=1 Tax=Acinetobacter beijerinckii TaxID=262668 RepID=UPI00300B3ABC